jgi:CRP-like cAMP-binding protein
MITIMSGFLFDALRQQSTGEQALAPEERLFHRGDQISSIYLLLSGVVDLVRYQRDGSAVVLNRVRTQTVVAEASLYAEQYHCDGVCVESATVQSVPRASVTRLLRDDPNLAEQWSIYLAQELQDMRYHCELLTRRTVAERLSGWLDWNGTLPPKGRWKDVATEIGVSPEALYREIKTRQRQTPNDVQKET